MNEALYGILKDKFRANCNDRKNGYEHIKKEIISITKTDLEASLQENSHLLNEEMDLQTALKDFFEKLKAEIEESIEDFNDYITDSEENDSLDQLRKYKDSSYEELKFATELENHVINNNKK